MKKISKFILILLTIAMLFSACTTYKAENETDENPFEDYNVSEKNNNNDSIYIDSGVVGFDKDNFEYNGKPIEFDYKFYSNKNCEMGLELYVNGILQEFTVDNNKYSLYKTKCKENEDNIFHVSFVPNVGKKGDNLSLIFANVYNPEIIEYKDENNTFGNNQKISQPQPWGIKMNSDSNNKKFNISTSYKEHSFTNEELKEFTKILKDGTKENTLDQFMRFSTSKEFETISLSKEKTITFELYGNLEGKYRISLYGDFEKTHINKSDYIDIDVKKNTKYSIEVNTSDLKNYKNVYAVAVSLDNTEGIIKSPSYFINK